MPSTVSLAELGLLWKPMSCEVPCMIVPQADMDVDSNSAAPTRVKERFI
jgi:hypothetical protein